MDPMIIACMTGIILAVCAKFYTGHLESRRNRESQAQIERHFKSLQLEREKKIQAERQIAAQNLTSILKEHSPWGGLVDHTPRIAMQGPKGLTSDKKEQFEQVLAQIKAQEFPEPEPRLYNSDLYVPYESNNSVDILGLDSVEAPNQRDSIISHDYRGVLAPANQANVVDISASIR